MQCKVFMQTLSGLEVRHVPSDKLVSRAVWAAHGQRRQSTCTPPMEYAAYDDAQQVIPLVHTPTGTAQRLGPGRFQHITQVSYTSVRALRKQLQVKPFRHISVRVDVNTLRATCFSSGSIQKD